MSQALYTIIGPADPSRRVDKAIRHNHDHLYHVCGTVQGVGDRYSLTVEGLHNVGVYGVEPREVWEALHATRRLTRQVADDANAVFGVTGKGRYLVVLVVESANTDNDWDIVAAREMYPDEMAMFDQYAGGRR